MVRLTSESIEINGEAKILLCASLFYFRIPSEDWEERMIQLRSAGYNCIDVYMPWNFHEIAPGVWNFSGMRDVDAFLTLAEKHQLYVIARPGPYICSEWDGGALPSWIHELCPELRQNDDQYLAELKKWFDRIFPVIVKHQETRNGAIVAVQLENELDYFACEDPAGYLRKLKEFAVAYGVDVPCIACAGECDVQGAGVEFSNVKPSFNAYADLDYPYMEMQLAHMRGVAASFDAPLLITETDREHAKIKRELLAGARLIAPYNQVGGTDVDMYNGIGNWMWGSKLPLSLMATDYDFHSMLTVSGHYRKEAGDGRLLGTMIASLGSHLAAAVPDSCPVTVNANFATARAIQDDQEDCPCFPTLKMDCGYLFGISNLSKQDGLAVVHSGEVSFKVPVGACETVILPWKFSLKAWGVNATVCYATAEILCVRHQEKELCLYLHGKNNAFAVIETESQRDIVTIGQPLSAPGLRVILLETDEAVAMRQDALPNPIGTIPSVLETTASDCAFCSTFDLYEHAAPVLADFGAMENMGVYRGDAFYECEHVTHGDYLLRKAADFVWIYQEDGCVSFCGDGSTRKVTLSDGRATFRVQSWGHANFDDVRQPSLKMNSHKGILSMDRIISETDLTDFWFIFPDAKYQTQKRQDLRNTDRILATSINSWSYPVTPMRAVFRRQVYFRPDCEVFYLYVENTEAEISVGINGNQVGSFVHHDSWLLLPSDLVTPGQSAELELTITRQFSNDSVGRVILVGCIQVPASNVRTMTANQWAAMDPGMAGTRLLFPVSMRPGEEKLLTGFIPEAGKRSRVMVLNGSGLEAVLVGHDHVIGRVKLETEGFPDAKGGSSRRVYVPAAWQDGCVYLHLTGIGSRIGILESIQWETLLE